MNITPDEARLTEATRLARNLHTGQVWKSNGEDVFTAHLLQVAQLVFEYGSGDPAIDDVVEVTCAAYLHDAIEDQNKDNVARIQIEGICGKKVLALVEECTEPGTGSGAKAPWRERKEGYLEMVQRMTPGALLISGADKTQQVRALESEVAIKGDDAYTFSSQSKASTLWFFNELSKRYHLRSYSPRFAQLLEHYDAALAVLNRS